MKLVGSYTSPFVRKLSILLLEKGITFEFINELPYNADNGVAQFNPLGKVPVLVTEEGDNHRYDAGNQDSVAEIELGSVLVSQF